MTVFSTATHCNALLHTALFLATYFSTKAYKIESRLNQKKQQPTLAASVVSLLVNWIELQV